jgi:cyclic-di-GMP-binding protein
VTSHRAESVSAGAPQEPSTHWQQARRFGRGCVSRHICHLSRLGSISQLLYLEMENPMASNFSFDVVSKFDFQELKNAVDQAQREIHQRYDLKDTGTDLALTEKDITINTATEYSLQAVRDTLESKLIRRGLSLKILDYQKEEQAAGGRMRQSVKLREGLPEEIAKKLSKQIRDGFKKVTPQIQGDLIRVQAKSKDDLQAVIESLKEEDLPVALQFVNYR